MSDLGQQRFVQVLPACLPTYIPACLHLGFIIMCAVHQHHHQRTCSTPCFLSVVSQHEQHLSRTALLPHQADSGALVIPDSRWWWWWWWYRRIGEELSMRPVVGTQQRSPQILCHCAGASMRRARLAQPGGASSAGSRQTVQFVGCWWGQCRCCCCCRCTMDGDGWVHTARIASVQRNVAKHVDTPASSQQPVHTCYFRTHLSK